MAESLELNRAKIAARLAREGWVCRHGGNHDVYTHPSRPKAAGWIK